MICYVFRNKRGGKARKAWRGRYRLKPWSPFVEILLHTHDKVSAISELHKIVLEAQQEAAGIIPPKAQREAAKKNIATHLEEMAKDIAKTGRDADDVYNTEVMITRLARECKWTFLADVTPDSFQKWRTDQNHAPTTLNRYLETMKRFLNWLVHKGSLSANPLKTVATCETRQNKRRKRRALSDDECRCLLEVAGPRRIVYLTVLNTGLRRGEIGQVKWSDFHLDPPRPYLKVRGSIAKNHEDANLKLHAELVEALRAYRSANAKPSDLVFPKVPTMDEYRADLECAYIPYRDEDDRLADFHSLRHTFGTRLSVNGVNPRLIMALMRHSDIELTMKDYTDTMRLPTDEVIDQMPGFGIQAHNETHKILSLSVLTWLRLS